MKCGALRYLIVMPLVLLLANPPGVARAAESYTGLIIVVQGVHLDRSMSPAVLTPEGEVVYGRGWWKPGQLSQEFFDAQGIVEYASSMETARRAGARPLVVIAIGVSGPPSSNFKTDVIIREADAARIRKANAQGRFLEHFHVSIVIEPLSAEPEVVQ